MEIRAASAEGHLTFEGVASVVDRGYEMMDMFGPYTEIVGRGAFDESLARADLDVPLVLGHDQMRRIARTTSTISPLVLSMTDEGLHVLAERLDPADPDVSYAAGKMRAGLLDEMSFAFRIEKGWWSDDWSTYLIEQVDIHRGDTALVGFGANPYTSANLGASGEEKLAAQVEAERISAEIGRTRQLARLDAILAEARA